MKRVKSIAGGFFVIEFAVCQRVCAVCGGCIARGNISAGTDFCAGG
jgi:hypothetical protein